MKPVTQNSHISCTIHRNKDPQGPDETGSVLLSAVTLARWVGVRNSRLVRDPDPVATYLHYTADADHDYDTRIYFTEVDGRRPTHEDFDRVCEFSGATIETVEPGSEQDTPTVFGYYINCDERGAFNADVRNHLGQSIFEISAEDGRIDLVEDGYMRNAHDIKGLESYLIDTGVLQKDAEILVSQRFEERLEEILEEHNAQMEEEDCVMAM